MQAIEIPAWALLAIGLVFSFAFTWTFDKAFRTLFEPVLKRVADIGFGGVGVAGHKVGAVHPFGFLNKIVENVNKWSARTMQGCERGIVYSINKVIDTGALLFGVPLAIALALYELAQYATHKIGQAVTRVEHTTVIKKVGAATKVITEVTKAQFSHLTARVATIEHRIAHFAHAIPATVATPFPRIRRIEHDLTSVKARLKKAEKALAVGASAALVLTALKRLGLGWLRCNNVGKAGKAVCGMNPSLLEALLLEAAALTVTFNLEEFARELQTVTGEAASLIHKFAD